MFFAHTVANADFGKDVLRICRILFHFTAYIGHVYTEDPVVIICVWSPDIIDDRRVGHNFSAVLCEKYQDLILDRSQMNDISADGQGTFFKIEYQLATFVRMEELIRRGIHSVTVSE